LTESFISAIIVSATKIAEYFTGGMSMKTDKGKLTLAMARACMNPQDLAKAAELPPQTVNGVIRGKSVRPATLGKVAKALGVDPADIIAKEE
jgi:DNA-binding Xre family transcriptional regulator